LIHFYKRIFEKNGGVPEGSALQGQGQLLPAQPRHTAQVREREEVDVSDDQGRSARTNNRHRTHKHSPKISAPAVGQENECYEEATRRRGDCGGGGG